MAVKKKSPRTAGGMADVLTTVPAPVTAADKIVFEIRKFIASAIFFNAQAAEKVGLSLTDMQMIHVLQLYWARQRLAVWLRGTGLSTGGVTVALDRLQRAGYIRREPNPADRRSLIVTLAPVRNRKLFAIYGEVESKTRRLLATLPSDDLEAVIRFFETLRAAQADGKS